MQSGPGQPLPSQARPCLPPLSLPPFLPPSSGSHPASHRRAGWGEGVRPAAPGKRSFWFWLYECLGFSCVFFPSKFRFQTGAHTFSGAESSSQQRAGSALPRQARPHFPFGASAHGPWLQPYLQPASLVDPTTGWAEGLRNAVVCNLGCWGVMRAS